VSTIIAKPNSRSSTGAFTIRTPVIAWRSYRTAGRPVSTPLTTSWNNNINPYAVQNALRRRRFVRQTA